MEKWEQIARQSFSKEFEDFKKSLSGGRRPDGVSFTNIEGDVKRRDLTINALFYDIETQEIVDLVGGMNDIKNGVVRTVGAPEDRFAEDRLRIMRAIRFAGRFGSELDPATDAALQKDAALHGVSGERIRDEFIKCISSAKSVKHILTTINKYGLFNFLFQGLKVTLEFIEDKDPVLVIATLLKDNTVEALRKTLNGLKYSVDEVKAISFLVAMLKLSLDTAVTLKKAQEHAGVSPEQIKSFCARQGVDSKLLDAFLKFRLSVSGPEVMDAFSLKPGPEVGKKIQQLETDNFKKLI